MSPATKGVLAVLALLIGSCPLFSGESMSSATNKVARSAVGAGGDHQSSSANNKLGATIGEEVVGANSTSVAYALAPGALNQFSFPGTINNLAPTVTASSVSFQWTAPGYDGGVGALQSGTSYYIRIASFTVPDTFTPQQAQIVFSVSGVNPGVLQTTGTASLLPNTTYFAQIWTVDAAGNSSYASPRATFTTTTTLPNAIPDLLAKVGGNPNDVELTWTAPSNPNGAAISKYTVKMSTVSVAALGGNAEAWFNLANSTTFVVSPALSPGSPELLTISGLPLSTTFYFGIKSEDVVAEVSPIDTKAAGVTTQARVFLNGSFQLPPLEPVGLKAESGPTTVALTWSATTRFSDGRLFANPSSPTAAELLGYIIRRSTGVINPNRVFVASTTAGVTTYTDTTGGQSYHYDVRSYNSHGISSSTIMVSSLNEQNIALAGGQAVVTLTTEQAASLAAASAQFGGDVTISARRRTEDLSAVSGVIQSAEFKVMLNGVTEVRSFAFNTPAKIVLSFAVVGGAPAPSGMTPAEGDSGLPLLAGSDVKNLGVFWYNGTEFKKLYGKVDPVNQTVTAETPNLGLFQVRTQLRAGGAVFDLSNLSSRVITPNGDGLNDVMIFTYDPGPSNVRAEGAIYDVNGAYVSDLRAGPTAPNTTLIWDGKMNGRAVTSGVYVYQIKGDGKTLNGTVVVAR